MSVDADRAGAVLTIDNAALAANYCALAAMAPGSETAAVVKADAYGTGLENAGRVLRAAGARTFFVAHPEEGLRLRPVVGDDRIYILNGLFADAAADYIGHALVPVLGTRDEIDAWSAFSLTVGVRLPAALHVDTGLNRLGLSMAEMADIAAKGIGALPFDPILVMSHFAAADEPGHPLTAKQIERFAEVRRLFPGVPGSLANSAGLTIPEAAAHEIARPGVALYGACFVEGRDPLTAVVRLDARVLQVRVAVPGETVGYGAGWTVRRTSRIAVVSAGYADGYPRMAGSSDVKAGAQAIVNGRRVPLAGRVSMDLIAVDVTDAGAVARGDMVTLIGDGIGVDEVAATVGTTGYEVLTRLGNRYHRRYSEA